MSSKNKINREKYRQEIARQYNEELRTLRNKIKELEQDNINLKETIKEQNKKIQEQEEKINVYKMIINRPESEIVDLLDKCNTKIEFLELIHNLNKIIKNS